MEKAGQKQHWKEDSLMPFAWPALSWAWSGPAWLGLAFCRWFLHPFSFFLGQVYADAESRWKEREKEGERSAENGRQTRLEIFARSQWGRERGLGKHVKEQLLKRIYRFIYVFVCAMWVHRYSQLAREEERGGGPNTLWYAAKAKRSREKKAKECGRG